MDTSVALLLELGVILVLLSLLGALARRLTLSPVPLYLLDGLSSAKVASHRFQPPEPS